MVRAVERHHREQLDQALHRAARSIRLNTAAVSSAALTLRVLRRRAMSAYVKADNICICS
jgi:hypothetical protein